MVDLSPQIAEASEKLEESGESAEYQAVSGRGEEREGHIVKMHKGQARERATRQTATAMRVVRNNMDI